MIWVRSNIDHNYNNYQGNNNNNYQGSNINYNYFQRYINYLGNISDIPHP